jgi:hypothetical protein
MQTKATCATRAANKCEVREKCVDDATSTEPRSQVYEVFPDVKGV